MDRIGGRPRDELCRPAPGRRPSSVDPITHTLSGIVAAQILPADLPRATATMTMAIAANLPDVDAFLRRLKSTAFIEYHHGLTHSLVGMVVLAGLFSLIWGPLVSQPFLTVYSLSILGCLLHTAGDLLIHIYKIPLLAPFSRRRFGASLLIGLNPLTSSARCGERSLRVCARCQLHSAARNLILCILASCVFIGLVTGRLYALSLTAAALVALYLAFTLLMRRMAQRMFLARCGMAAAKAGPAGGSVHLYPASFLPFRWLCVVEDSRTYRVGLLDLLRPEATLGLATLAKPDGRPAFEAARETATVRPLIEKAFPPYASAEPNEKGTLVKWKDLAYAFDERIDLFTAVVQLSPDGAVLSEEFRERW